MGGMRCLAPLFALSFALVLAPTEAASPPRLPPAVQQALKTAQLPPEALALWVAPVDSPRPRWRWREAAPQNPASLAKLATSFAALEQLGPAWRWKTPVWLDGTLEPERGLFKGDLVIQGRGDPSLVLERVWLLLRRVQQLGVREIQGDIVLDNRAFAPDTQSPADFDGEPWRAGNVRPDALLFNYKAHSLLVRPDPARGVAWLQLDTGLSPAQDRVPLKPGPCLDGRGQLRASWLEEAGRTSGPLRLAGSWPASCGEAAWPLADPEPASYNARLIETMWRALGGKLTGWVRAGNAPADRAASFELSSPPLSDVVQDINKHSNNLMAEQLWLTLALQAGSEPATAEAARQGLRLWLRQRLGWPEQGWQLDNGSGLARGSRLSAAQLGQLLQAAWASAVMPEFMASLPIVGEDGTLRREPARFGPARGRAHLKTGSLRDVQAVAGYLLTARGERLVVVAMIQHERAGAGRPVLETLLRSLAQ